MAHIPFNVPHIGERELEYIRQAVVNRHLAGNGPFTAKCHARLRHHLSVEKVLLTHSCTAALEMAAILAEIGQGDEVIMPSFTFVSTANAVVLRGTTPVFVDIRTDTLTIDPDWIEEAITPRTRAVFPVHYAGVAAEMDPILRVARAQGLSYSINTDDPGAFACSLDGEFEALSTALSLGPPDFEAVYRQAMAARFQ